MICGDDIQPSFNANNGAILILVLSLELQIISKVSEMNDGQR